MISYKYHLVVKLTVFPSAKRTSDSWMKNIVLMRVRSIVHPNTVAPPGLDCKYVTAESKKGVQVNHNDYESNID